MHAFIERWLVVDSDPEGWDLVRLALAEFPDAALISVDVAPRIFIPFVQAVLGLDTTADELRIEITAGGPGRMVALYCEADVEIAEAFAGGVCQVLQRAG